MAIADSNHSRADACDLRYLLDYVAKKPFPKSVRWQSAKGLNNDFQLELNLTIWTFENDFKPCICKQNRNTYKHQFSCGNHPHSGKLPHIANSMRTRAAACLVLFCALRQLSAYGKHPHIGDFPNSGRQPHGRSCLRGKRPQPAEGSRKVRKRSQTLQDIPNSKTAPKLYTQDSTGSIKQKRQAEPCKFG